MEKSNIRDPERGSLPAKISYQAMLLDQGVLTQEMLDHKYDGAGTEDDPYAVVWLDQDPRNPMQWNKVRKWTYVMSMAIATLSVAFCSSAFSGGIQGLIAEFRVSQEVVTLGLSLFVLGFALGPLIFAPLSEMYGRQIMYVTTFAAFTAFNAGCAGARNIQSLIILRFFAGSFGSSPLTNAGGVIADLFNARERGVATTIFAAAPFLGPVLGPIIGGFLGQYEGWRWVHGFMAIFTGVLWIAASLIVPETFAPVLLRKRAMNLSKLTGRHYKSQLDIDQGQVTPGEAFKTAIARPWILLFREPIVFILSVYMAIIYGTLYMLFGAYPIVYQRQRGWSAGIGGLAFIGVAIGMLFAIVYSIFIDNKRYQKITDKLGGMAPPEARLHSVIIGGCVLPVGLFWFAWTNSPSLPWAASMAAGIPFGFGMVLVFLGLMNYLIDSYTIFAASVLAANSVLRSCFGAAFPLFTSQMYNTLGIHWASSIPGFLALACTPFPFLFYKYGARIRAKCKFASQSEAFINKMRERAAKRQQDAAGNDDEEGEVAHHHPEDVSHRRSSSEGTVVDKEAVRNADMDGLEEESPRFEKIKTARERRPSNLEHTMSGPYDIDRFNTRESFTRTKSGRSR